ncbi:hypothetical protein BJP36_15750 [Moorena producens JHB]|uniref:Uncharacterized protein n=1 Tax=Moorena producens (strain JHB) TaxID=1454205 RepID=A0A9Q9UWS5_MOOP1|nr:hypothetical protein [Moorena producens]WAN70206.1 hypothetical protein BJP36_15750 [Moorena producens JHB]
MSIVTMYGWSQHTIALKSAIVWAVCLEQIDFDLYQQSQWDGLQTIVMVIRTRHLWNKTTREVMFYLSSLLANAQQLGNQPMPNSWVKLSDSTGQLKINFTLVLDVTFGEDNSRIRTGHAPQNMALLKRWSINLLNQETSYKRSTRQKTKRASMDTRYMLKILKASIPLQSNLSGA